MATDLQICSVVGSIKQQLKSLSKSWDGKQSILDMKNNNCKNWRQMEWIGFYFQFLCECSLSNVLQIPGLKYGNAIFDAFNVIPWDFKTHVINSNDYKIICNDSQAVITGIEDYGAVGLILALGQATYNDKNGTFKKWHDSLKGKNLSEFELKRIERGAWSRLRKTEFDLQQIEFIKITTETLDKSSSFQKDFRNANGNPRNSKVILDLNQLDKSKEIIDSIYF